MHKTSNKYASREKTAIYRGFVTEVKNKGVRQETADFPVPLSHIERKMCLY